MPKKSPFETEAATLDVPETLFNVIINGVDMAVYAKDKADLNEKIAKIRATFPA